MKQEYVNQKENQMYDKYSQETAMKTAAMQAEGCLVGVDRNPTVGENIDSKIAMLSKEIERLKASKVELAPLMNMRIRDIRDAMNY
jgi:uncharacterized small protein (DUF1192 family)